MADKKSQVIYEGSVVSILPPTSDFLSFNIDNADPNIDFTFGESKQIVRIENEGDRISKIVLDHDQCKDAIIEGDTTLDVEVIKTDTGYKVKKTVQRWIPETVEVEEDFKDVIDDDNLTVFYMWAQGLSNDDLDAAVQVYYDRWNFENGNVNIRMRYIMLTELQEQRRG